MDINELKPNQNKNLEISAALTVNKLSSRYVDIPFVSSYIRIFFSYRLTDI